jgi:hypothetical protein
MTMKLSTAVGRIGWGMAIMVGLLLPGAASATDLTFTWIGTGGDDLWSTSGNWSPAVSGGPRNESSINAFVEILSAGPVDFDRVDPTTISGLTLADNQQLNLLSGTDLSVSTSASIAGILNSTGGVFTSGVTDSLTGDRARLYVSTGGQITLPDTTYNSKGLWNDWDANGYNHGDGSGTWEIDVLRASGADSLIDLSSVTLFDAGFAASGNDYNYQ